MSVSRACTLTIRGSTCFTRMVQSLWWAAGYNIIALVIVALNAQTLRRLLLRDVPAGPATGAARPAAT